MLARVAQWWSTAFTCPPHANVAQGQSRRFISVGSQVRILPLVQGFGRRVTLRLWVRSPPLVLFCYTKLVSKIIRELFLLHVLNDGVRTTFIVLLPFITKDLLLPYAYVGFLGSFQSLAGTLLALPAGFIAARVGGFHLLSALLFIYTIGALGVGLSPNILLLTLSFAVGAFGFGMFHTVGYAVVAKSAQKASVGKLMGDFTSIGDVGRIGLPPLALFAASFMGWRFTMLALAGIGFVAYIFIRFLSPARDIYQLQQPETGGNNQDFFKTILILLRIKKLLLILAAAVVDSLAGSPMNVFLPFLLLAKGITFQQLAFIMGVYFVGSMLGKSLLGRGVDRYGNVRVFVLSEVCMAAILILLIWTSPIFLIFLFVLLLGAFTRGTNPVVLSMLAGVTHEMHYNKIYAVSEIVIAAASVTTGIAMGLVADRLGITTVFYLLSALAVVAIFPLFPFLFGKNRLNHL